MRLRANRLASVLLGCAIWAITFFGPTAVQSATSKPNIIFIILDDVGIDLLATFGNGGLDPPKTPNIDLLAAKGVKFTNAWAMPECSPTRAAVFTGRYAIHTGVEAAIVENHLPQSYVSSFETTLPRVLEKAGYTSALIGKYHLGNAQDPAGNCAPSTRGFPFFQGLLSAAPPAVDTTAGGVDPSGGQVCGYFQTQAAGACYTANGGSCALIDSSSADPGTDPARTCLQHGGIFVPNQACGVNPPPSSAFSRLNAYYVSARTTLTGALNSLFANASQCTATDTDRRYLTSGQGADGEAWWQQQTGPRMLTLSFNAIHTPVQKAPTDLVPDPLDQPSSCNNALPPPPLINSMIEGTDTQIGRTLAHLGLATLAPDGRTMASLNLGNTMVVLIGDNGSLAQTVRIESGFNPARAKTTVYQTGVSVPLIIAGAPVASPGRSVDALVNVVDLFELFGDVAGIDVKSTVPPSHALDSQPLLPYLTDPAAAPIRATNFVQEGVATYSPVPSERSWPCVVGNFCNDTLFNTPALCAENGGTWYGPGGAAQLPSCCAVQTATGTTLSLAPVHQYAVRNGRFKLVELQALNCSKPITDPSQKAFPWADYQVGVTQELYDLILDPLGLDNAPGNLAQNCAPGQDISTCLPTQIDVTNYQALNNTLQGLKASAASQNACRAMGDGNLDQRVTQADIDGWKAFNGKGPSAYDINLDGQTDEADLAIIQAHLGVDCLNICTRADLNRDGKVDSADMTLLNQQTGACTDATSCGGDLNGDGQIDGSDVQLMQQAQQSCRATASTSPLVAATLPASRSVRVGRVASAFATVINTGPAATGCTIAPVTTVPAGFIYQTTDPTTNALTGTPDTPATIASGGRQTFFLGFGANAEFPSTDVVLNYSCTNVAPVTPIVGVNTLQLTFDANPVPDIIAVAASTDPGYVSIPSPTSTGAFAVAAANIGVVAPITVSADTGAASLPLDISVCQTDSLARCTSPMGPSVSLTFDPAATATFSVFVKGAADITDNPAANRVFVRFKDPSGITRGSTSVAVRTAASVARTQ